VTQPWLVSLCLLGLALSLSWTASTLLVFPICKRRILAVLAHEHELYRIPAWVFGSQLGVEARVPRWCLYAILDAMEDEGLVSSRKEDVIFHRDDKVPRTAYAATPKGLYENSKWLLKTAKVLPPS
jgi:DNA-binding PadR family transcriptional regulator